MLFLAGVSVSFGFFSPPTGQKAPVYPEYPSSVTNSSLDLPQGSTEYKVASTKYSQDLENYKVAKKQYDQGQKGFVQNKIVPYARNMFIGWVFVLTLLAVVGLVLAKFASELVGAGFMFTGVWVAIVGPLGGLVWFANSLVSGLARQAEAEFSLDQLFQAIGLTTIIGVIILSIIGIVLFPKRKDEVLTAPRLSA